VSTHDEIANVLVFGTREPTNRQVRREFRRLSFQFGCMGVATALAAPVIVLFALRVPEIAPLGWGGAVAMGAISVWSAWKALGLWRVGASVADDGLNS